jgi:hypothetical protein
LRNFAKSFSAAPSLRIPARLSGVVFLDGAGVAAFLRGLYSLKNDSAVNARKIGVSQRPFAGFGLGNQCGEMHRPLTHPAQDFAVKLANEFGAHKPAFR